MSAYLSSLVVSLQGTSDLAPILALPLERAGREALPRSARRRIDRALKRKRRPTVRDVLEIGWDSTDELAVEAWLRRLLDQGAPEVREGPRPGMAVDELRAWASRAGLGEAARWSAGSLLRASAEGVFHDLAYLVDNHSVAQVLTGAAPSWWFRHVSWTELQEAVCRELERQARMRAEALAQERARRDRRGGPPAEAALRSLFDAVRSARKVLRAQTAPTGWEDRLGHRVVDDPPSLVFERLSGRPVRPVTLRLDGEGELLQGSEDEPVLRLAVLDRTLDLLTAPEHQAERARLVALLSVPAWQRDLAQLDRLLSTEPGDGDDKPLLGWRIEPGTVSVQPVRCRPKKTGTGYVSRQEQPRGVPLAIARSPADRLVLSLLSGRGSHTAERVRAIEALVGHPRVFTDARASVPVPVSRGRFALRLHREAAGVRLLPALDEQVVPLHTFLARLEGRWVTGVLVDASDQEVRLYDVPPGVVDVLRGFAGRANCFPDEAVPELLARLPSLTEQLPVALDDALSGERIEGDPRPLLRLAWEPERVRVTARVRPLPEAVPQPPGEGPERLYAVREDGAVHVVRDLSAEATAVERALAVLPLPDAARTDAFTWELGTRDQALALIEALAAHPDRVQVEATGEVPRVRRRIAGRDLRVRVDRGRDWFGFEGSALVDGAEVRLAALLEAVEEGLDYVALTDGSFAAIASELRAELTAAAGAAGRERDGSRRLTPLHAPVVHALGEAGAEVDAPEEWLSVVDRMHEARALQAPVPEGLTATLRDYQVTGFRWLASLAHWAPGAILADDMGLGKTVQAIALLLHRAADGPALVVAPTSVVFNWERELARFAPSLRVRTYAGPDRADRLRDLSAGDVVLTTWALLQRDADALTALDLSTVVLDEAQAIKNPEAQRSKAACRLQARFRLALSGTPVENHLGELWSLFRAVAPGLLGGWTRFRERFVLPIEGQGDTSRRGALARLLRPFVLRRLKREVARELPDRIEVTLDVRLSADERALYDRARLAALARVSEGGAGRLDVLAELTRLRRLVCHPRLVDPGSPVPSSKLRQVLRVLRDLREGGHQALVFSQFTSHLALVREALEAEGFAVRYLDGGTPADQRRREVERFQAGEGDAFLLSLKAGGTGLNLTAASYVLHLDPWWNPASEDQATDRAHRIGQDKVVTVYRFIARGTIEDQIVALHGEKRELAEAILEGTGAAARASDEELLALLSDAPLDLLEDGEDAPLDLLEDDEEEPPPSLAVIEGEGSAATGRERPQLRVVHADALDLEDLVARFEASLAEERASRRIATDGTVRAYGNAARHMVAEIAADGPFDSEAFRVAAEAWVEEARAGRTRWKSDKVYARPAVARLLALL